MARFSRDDAVISWSPDRKYVAFVTTRGIVESDELESTLWIFPRAKIMTILGKGATAGTIHPMVGARIRATPKVRANDSYMALITDERWSSDSKRLLYLGQTSGGNRKLFSLGLQSRVVRGLTSAKYDVSQFEASAGTIIYRATPPRAFAMAGFEINRDAADITGHPIDAILPLFAKAGGHPFESELWTIRHGRNVPVIDPATNKPILLWNDPSPALANLNPVSISPDRRNAVVLTPSKQIPRSWEIYEPFLAEHKIRFSNGNAVQGIGAFRLLQYAMVDLDTGTTSLLIDAPNAWALGYTDGNFAIWSPEGNKLLLGDTYLPLSDDGTSLAENDTRRQPCAAAVYELHNKRSSCVAYSRGRSMSLESARFGRTDQEVFLRFGQATSEERFYYEDGNWARSKGIPDGDSIDKSHSRSDISEGLTVEIREDLNLPPRLWGTDRQTGATQMIWDPNPCLAAINLSEVSLFRWKDANGYEWHGGLVKPSNYIAGQRYPLVIQTHGFPEHEFMTDGAYTTAFAARALASRGIVVLQMADRFDDMVTSQEALNRILGFEAAIDQLVSSGLVDPKKVGIIGFSRTSYYVESALIRDPQRFAAATIADGVDYSYMQYLLRAEYAMALEADQIYGSGPFGQGLAEWTRRSPGFQLDRIQTPLRVEAIGPISLFTEREIYASLSKQNKPVDLIYFPNGQHILQKPLERMASQQGNVDWFCFWLLHQEDPDPSKRIQYAKWRQLRAESVDRSTN
jgi:dipeptidyl aminopeptidase/acylaminoacyl peptidase